MSAEKRFPSDANQPKAGKPKAAAKAAAAPKAVAASKQDLVQVQYSKKNHHVLQGVHALREGLNHVPREIWEAAKKAPAVAQLIKDGHALEMGVKDAAAKAADEMGDEDLKKLDSELGDKASE